MSFEPGILARGPWSPDSLDVRWLDDAFEAPAALEKQADAAIDELRERGSPCHDGMAARLVTYGAGNGRLTLDMQPIRWSLRLVDGDASGSIAALCAVRDADGRWLAGRRAAWVASWAGRWALGAGGSVEVGESPAETLSRELEEEWALVPERLSVEALIGTSHQLAIVVGMAWLPADAPEPTMDDEHDAFAWWPASVEHWPDEADAPLRAMAAMLANA